MKKTLGMMIAELRKEKGMTQLELAEKMYVSYQAVSAWERGVTLPDLENASKLADLFGVKIDTLLQGRDSNYYIAVDGGGTKTEFVLFEKNGKIQKRLVYTGTNPNAVGVENSISTLKKGIGELLHERSAKSIFIGVAGVTTGNHAEVIKQAISISFGVDTFVDSDGTNLLAMAKDPSNAAVVIAGTGSSIFIRKNYVRQRIGGWGYLFSQPGSAYSVGRQAIDHALAVNDGFEEKTALYNMVEEALGKNVWDGLSDIYGGGSSYISSFAPLVVRAAEGGDARAISILEEEAEGLARFIVHAKNKHGGPDEFLCAGGFMENTYFRRLLEKKSGISLYFAPHKQIYGAALECLRLCKQTPEEDFKTNFEESYR